MRRSGFTLMEVLTAVTIVGILASAGLPTYVRTIRRERGRAARNVLLTILAGEQTNQTLNGAYVNVQGCRLAPNPNNNPLVILLNTGCIGEWLPIFMDVPNVNNAVIEYRVTGATAAAFQGIAQWTGAPATDFMAVDQTGQISCLATSGIFGSDPDYGCMK